MKIYAYMECGVGKDKSEDTMLVSGNVLKEGYYVFGSPGECVAIADGVGGNAGGGDASEFVLERCVKGLGEDPKQTVLNVNDDLIAHSATVPGKEHMATTLSAVIFRDSVPSKLVHVGNTRVFAIRGDYLKQLTSDHTVVEYLRTRGDHDAAERAPQNEITSCLGAGDRTNARQLHTVEFDREYAGLVLTSDGLHDHLDEEDLEEFVSSGDYSEQAFIELSRKATDSGSDDDKSIIVVILREQ